MATLPDRQHSTASRIEEWRGSQPQEHRAHLGASVLGHDCQRHVWFLFRNALKPTFPGRLLRVFDRGKREEATVFEELRGIGVDLHVEDNGRQIECRDSTGHIGGSVDGIGRGFSESPSTWAVLEIKTHSAKSWGDLHSKGVKESKPIHMVQMQVYMGLLGIDRALYFAVNKDDDQLHTEWVHFDVEAFDALIDRGRSIVAATQPPPKLSEDPTFWKCSGCQHYSLCHEQRVPEPNCRTCCHATPIDGGKWQCEFHGKTLTRADETQGCDQHIFIPALIPYADPQDGGQGWVVYQHRASGKTFRNGVGGLSSQELHASIPEFVVDPVVTALRAQFGAKVVQSRGRKKADLSKIPCPESEPFNDEIPF